VITASLVNLLWWLQQFFNLKFWIRAGISRRDLTLTDEISLLAQTKNKATNNSHRQLVEIIGVPKFTIVQIMQQQDKVRDGLHHHLLTFHKSGTEQGCGISQSYKYVNTQKLTKTCKCGYYMQDKIKFNFIQIK
jgi:hypothetical protein